VIPAGREVAGGDRLGCRRHLFVPHLGA
jgi:hypothetical protein